MGDLTNMASAFPGTALTSPSRLMLDHPGWLTRVGGGVLRAFYSEDATWVISCDVVDTSFNPTATTIRGTTPEQTFTARCVVDWFDPASLPDLFQQTAEIRSCGRVHRARNPDLWDALLPQILRQRRHLVDAGRLYRSLCHVHGERLETPQGTAMLPPRPDTVATLDDDAFHHVGLRYKAHTLRAIATVYIKRITDWADLLPAQLCLALQEVLGIGAWTARMTVADITNDFSILKSVEFGTRATWERFAAQSQGTATPQDFGHVWQSLTGTQLSTMAALSVDWVSQRTNRRRTRPPNTHPFSRKGG